jgi:hypothetical protein
MTAGTLQAEAESRGDSIIKSNKIGATNKRADAARTSWPVDGELSSAGCALRGRPMPVRSCQSCPRPQHPGLAWNASVGRRMFVFRPEADDLIPLVERVNWLTLPLHRVRGGALMS